MSDKQVQAVAYDGARAFRDEVPVTAAQAPKIILDAVKAGQWRIWLATLRASWTAGFAGSLSSLHAEFYASFTKEAGLRQGSSSTLRWVKRRKARLEHNTSARPR